MNPSPAPEATPAPLTSYIATANSSTLPITPLTRRMVGPWLASVGESNPARRAWVESVGFRGDPGETCLLPGPDGALDRVLVGVRSLGDPWSYGDLPGRLPRRSYRLDPAPDPAAATMAALGWGLGTYHFSRYKEPRKFSPLVWPEGVDRAAVRRLVQSVFLGRDLINTPASDMGPEQLADVACRLAERHGARVRVIVGEDLLTENYPAVHAVGRACSRAPRLVDLRWGDHDNDALPRVTLCGKGVCFDSGGLDLKNAAGMKLMKKDMGGAATLLGLAHAIMDRGLPIRLRVLIPAVENSVSGDAFRPLDVLSTRKGLTVEVGNTDAEGRLILSDALAEASTEKPDLLIDMATLTGAARIALGTDLPALYCNDDELAAEVIAAGLEVKDPLWRMPLHRTYRKMLDSPIADLNNVAGSSYGGSITAALFLREFVDTSAEAGIKWIHIDTMAWNLESRPGRPSGGEAMALRALLRMLEKRYG